MSKSARFKISAQMLLQGPDCVILSIVWTGRKPKNKWETILIFLNKQVDKSHFLSSFGNKTSTSATSSDKHFRNSSGNKDKQFRNSFSNKDTHFRNCFGNKDKRFRNSFGNKDKHFPNSFGDQDKNFRNSFSNKDKLLSSTTRTSKMKI